MKEILTTLFRRKRAFLAFFACMVTFPLALTYLMAPTYQAKATVLLTPSRFKKPFLPDERDARTSFIQLSPEDVGSEVELMTSHPVLAQVVDTCGLAQEAPPPTAFPAKLAYNVMHGFRSALKAVGLVPDVPAREAAIAMLRGKVDVNFIRRTNIITIKWKGSSPELARDIVNAMVDAYMTHHIKVHGNAYVLDALRAELSSSQENLRAAQDSLSAYSSRFSISDVEAQRKDILDKLGHAETNIKLVGNMPQGNISAQTLGTLTEDASVTELSRRLTDAEMRRIDLGTRYGANDRKLMASTQEIEELKSLVQKRLNRSLAAWKAMAHAYRSELSKLDAHKVEIDRWRMEIEDLQRMVELNREKTDDALISKAMDKAAVAGARVVEEAVADPVPAFPKRMPLLFISVFFGVVLGIAFVIALDAGSLRVLSVDDVEKAAKAPVLASIPDFLKGKSADSDSPSAACAQALLSVPACLVRAVAGSPAMRSILMVSPSPGAGTTSLCNHLGGMLATAGSTAILSMDPQGIATGSDVGMALEPRLSGAMVRDERYGVYRMNYPAGPERLTAQGVVDSMREAGIRHLLIDAGAPRTDARYLQFAHLVDHVILVTACDLTSKPALARMAEVIRRQGGQLAGCLFNRRADVIPDFIYQRFF
ncbi:MAG: hypothetical protein ABI036_17440 [Fibrobacteria bacterium]